MTTLIWASFFTVVITLIVIDLALLHRKPGAISGGEAVARWLVWFILALLFNVYVYFLYETNWLGWGVDSILDLDGRQAATQFLTGYLIELSLSVDNVFVFALIFQLMRVPAELQHRVLFWGIFGAIVLRGFMIGVGVALVSRFEWVTYLFGIILILSAARMLALRTETGPQDIAPVRLTLKYMRVSPDYHGPNFFTIENGRRIATPLFLTLIMVEWADVIFAIDSIPAIFAVTTDPFLILTSNVFAILGLRSLYFLVADMVEKFRYLKVTLVFILMFVGIKMLLQHHIDIPSSFSLMVIAGSLTVGVVASLWANRFQSGTHS